MATLPADILLLSQSPRRKELLQSGGLHVATCPMNAPEDAQGRDPQQQAVAIARQKMAALDSALTTRTSSPHAHMAAHEPWAALTPQQLALVRVAADTLVVLGQQRLGKPRDAAEAQAMLQELSGAAHQVVTGVVLRLGAREKTLAVTTHVHFRKLTAGQIQAYVATGEPFDKAGGYGIQGLGGHLVQEVHGSLTNVIGLPLAETLTALQALWAQGLEA